MSLTLYTRTLALVGAILAVLLVGILAWFVHYERAHQHELLQVQLARVTNLQAVTVAGSMWNLNRESTQIILNGLEQHPNFHGAKLFTSTGKLFAETGNPDMSVASIIVQRQSVAMANGEVMREIGTLEVAFSLAETEDHLNEHLWMNLGLGLVLLTAALLLLAVILRHFLKPIELITDSLLTLANGELENDVPGTGRTDQIGSMARAVDQFRAVMIEIESLRQEDAARSAELASARDKLEERVLDRTQELQNSKARLAKAQSIAKLGSWTLDLETKEVDWSDNQYRLFGYEPHEVTPSLDLIIETIVPKERAEFIKTVEDKLSSLETSYIHEYRIVTKDGAVRTLNSTVEVARDETGKAYRMSGVYRDVTEQRASEKARLVAELRFKALVDNSPSAIILKDTNGKYLLANRQWHKWFNPDGIDIAGKTVYDFYPRDHADDVTLWDVEVIQTGKQFTREIRTPLPDGKFLTTMFQKFPVIDDSGEVVAVGGFDTDISDLKEAHIALKLAVAEANRANKSKSEFLSNMSHELRTPLNGILGFSEMMKLETLGPLSKEIYGDYVDMINDAGIHLLDIISQILDISRIESGNEELDETRVQVHKALEFSLNNLEQRFSRYNLRVSTNIADDLPDLLVDKTRFEQILTNLISNAIKYNKPDGLVKVETSIDDTGRMAIAVSDSGIGIKEIDINRVQDRFERVQSSITHKTDGIGLGLPIVRLLSKLHRAEFYLESVVGEGTTATVVFPKERVLEYPARDRLAV